jgi:maltose/moltooligosaccharide transporter
MAQTTMIRTADSGDAARVEPLLDETPLPLSERRWHVGTLTYTAAGLVVLFFWLLWGDFAWSMKDRAITPVAQAMLAVFRAPNWFVGLLVGSIPAGIGMVLGPIISVKSDRHRGRWGRRIPFLLIPTPILMFSMFGLAVAPMAGTRLHTYLGAHAPSEAACQIAAFSFFWAIFEIAQISVATLIGALINDVVPQQLIGRFFGLMRAVSLIAGILFNHYLMGKAKTHYFGIFVSLGLLYGIGFTLMCWRVREGNYPPPPPKEDRAKSRFGAAITYLKECYTNPFYLWYILATIAGGLATWPVNQFSLYHARSIGLSDDLYGNSNAISYCVSLALAYPLGALADRIHPLRMAICTMALYAAGTLYGFCFGTHIWTFFAGYVLHTILSGCYFTGTASIAQRLLPRAKFAEFLSAAGIVGAICAMILPPALGFLVDDVLHTYRFVFLVGSVLATISVAAYTVLFIKFKALGGDKAYVAPGDSPEA